jgi:transmembrane sensor
LIREALTLDWLNAMSPAEAAAHFVAREAEGLTPSEQHLLAAWVAGNDGNARELATARRAWAAFADSDGDEILNAMRKHALKPVRQTRPTWRVAASAVAAVCALIFLSTLLIPSVFAPGPRSSPSPTDTMVRYASLQDQVRRITLPDGSEMTLDARSVAIARVNPEQRTVRLVSGRAFFAVAPAQAHRFEVLAGGETVTAIGTQFDVSLLASALTVTLVEGHVTVGSARPNSATVRLQPGQQFVLQGGRALIVGKGQDAAALTEWRTGRLYFDDQPLSEAIAVVNRYSSDQIVLRDPSVGKLSVSGQFRAGDVSRFADTVADLHHLQSVRRGNRIELRK